MKRINEVNINKPELSEKIFKERWHEVPHYIDWERFKLMARYFKGGKYLDIGCFNSPMPGELKIQYSNSEIHAIDHSRYIVEKMQSFFPEVSYKVMDAMRLDFSDQYFDYIVAGELIEHLESPADFIKEAMRVLKPGGYMAISTPKEEGSSGVSDEHLWSFTQEDLLELFNPYGVKEVKAINDNFPLFIVWCLKT